MECSLFSVSYAGLWGQVRLNLPEFIEKASCLEYRTVMLAGKRPHLSVLDFSNRQIEQLKELLIAKGVKVAAVAGYTDFSDPPASEVPFVEMQIAYIEQLAKIANELQAPVVRLFTAYDRAGQNLSNLWNKQIVVLREASERAQPWGITLAVQNHHDLAVHTDALIDMITEVDRSNCRLGFDAWSPALRGEDLYEAARKAAPLTVITTNADYIRLPRYVYRPELINYEPVQPALARAVPFGTGFIDYKSFFQGLRDGGFDGIANYEICSPIRGGGSMANLDRCALAYRQWMVENGYAIK